MCKKYIITDGTSYINFESDKKPRKVGSEFLAKQFNNLKSANDYLLSPMMVKLNKDNGKIKFNVKELEIEMEIEESTDAEDFKKSIVEEIQKLDGGYYDFTDIRISDKDNKHVYSGKTYIEENNIDIVSFMKTVIGVFSCLETYVENMCYLERESDLSIQDYRHFKRDESTKMDSISASKLEYIEQEIERERITNKRNRLIGQLILKDISRIKDEKYIDVIDSIQNSEYRYRRVSKEQIKEMISTRKSKLKAV
jgi:hypothetical protein